MPTPPTSGAHLTDEERIAETLAADTERLTPAERRAELVVGGGFVLAAALLLALFPAGSMDVGTTALVVVAMAAAMGVRFPVPSGYTVPGQLVLVPALFILPAGLVPLAMAAALVLSRVPEVVRGTMTAHRLFLVPANTWFAVAPAAVFGVAGVEGVTPAACGVLALALVAQLVTDFAVSGLRERLAGGPPLRSQLAEAGWVYAVDVALTPVGLLVALAAYDTPVAIGLLLPLLGLLQVFAAERRNRMAQLVELGNAYRGTAMVLGDVVESDDAYTGEHTRGVVELALAVSDEMGLDPQTRQRVEFGALLHDVGKVAVPKEIINKAGPLDPHEWEIIKTHTLEGQRMLDTVGGLMRHIGTIVRAHHERWDGGGYPDGLAGDDIPVESRIVSACDTWNAMTTNRSYRSALPREIALEELLSVSGSQLDPAVVDALVRVLEATPAPPVVVAATVPAAVPVTATADGGAPAGDPVAALVPDDAAPGGAAVPGGLQRVLPPGVERPVVVGAVPEESSGATPSRPPVHAAGG